MIEVSLKEALKTTAQHLKRLNELGIFSVQDLLHYFPRTYEDQRQMRRIIEMKAEEVNTLDVRIGSIHMRRARNGKKIIAATCVDDTGTVEATWFNQPHLMQILRPGTNVIVSGKLKWLGGKQKRLVLQSPVFEVSREELRHTARLVPVYHETGIDGGARGKISSKWIREKLYPLLPYAEICEEYMPADILAAEKLMPYPHAIATIHFPKDEHELSRATERLSFDELFLIQLGVLQRRYHWRHIGVGEGKAMKTDFAMMKNFLGNLPFELTRAQKVALKEILDDLAKPNPMSRLLQGDVGSGKTIVAAAAALHAVKAGWQVCMMAPTEILAAQHFKNVIKFLQPLGLNIQFIAGSSTEGHKKTVIAQMKEGTVDIVIGTHSLIQERIGFARLGLAIIDEQHRFGVKQREKLKDFGNPHLLSLTATPIPRTLALTIYGDQDLSIIDEMPPGRQPILTRIVPPEKRADAYAWIRDQIKEGRQVFIICPLVDEMNLKNPDASASVELKAAKQEFERLKDSVFTEEKMGLLYGKMKQDEKEAIMREFSGGKLDILVSTSVVEVGIDVPNATVILIEGAERFGLAQLHQFRGRVGRGEYKSYCFLFPSFIAGEIMNRLGAMERFQSGFRLAEIDLALRGPGSVYGIRQSGIPDLKMAHFGDSKLLARARNAATKIIMNDAELNNYPKLKKKIDELSGLAIDY